MSKPLIFAFINSGSPGWFNVIAVCPEGDVVASHVSSNEYWAKHDIGVTSDWKHDRYNEKYQEGWEIEWLDNPLEEPRLKPYQEANQALAAAAAAEAEE